MHSVMRRLRRQGAVALIATLALFVILTMMIAVAIRGNVTQRKYILLRQEEAQALCLAESGISEAIRNIVRRTAEPSLERAIGAGAFRVRWQETQPGNGVYEIYAVGIADVADPNPTRRAVTVRVQVGPGHREGGASLPVGAGAPSVRILSWQSSSASR